MTLPPVPTQVRGTRPAGTGRCVRGAFVVCGVAPEDAVGEGVTRDGVEDRAELATGVFGRGAFDRGLALGVADGRGVVEDAPLASTSTLGPAPLTSRPTWPITSQVMPEPTSTTPSQSATAITATLSLIRSSSQALRRRAVA
ncbi:MAG: hypothetical protein ABI776_08495 [Nocardioidaceae bacterium]